MNATDVIPQPYRIEGNDLVRKFHPGQWDAVDSTARFVVVLAGTQGGKTSFGPFWLYDEITKRGPGDYLVVTPTYPLLNLKALPVFLNLFKTILGLGDYRSQAKVFAFDALGEIRTWGEEQTTPTRVIFGHAQDPESLESAEAKAAWLDEAGQGKFKLSSFEAIIRRLSIAQGRILITTTPYNLGWLKQQLYDRRDQSDIDVIRFDSTLNPAFPPEEMERAKRDLPAWKFNMFYRALFTRPAGMIYDCFEDDIHKIAPFAFTGDWQRYIGLDFGGVNTAAVYIAKNSQTGEMVLYDEYHAGGRTASQHVAALNAAPGTMAYGGAGSEDQWRQEFSAGGLHVNQPPIKEVEVGINRVYGALQRGELKVFNTCHGWLDEVMTYSRSLNDLGQPTEKIADKETFHLLDATRYIMSYLARDDWLAW